MLRAPSSSHNSEDDSRASPPGGRGCADVVRLEPIAPKHQKDLARLAADPEVAATSNLPHPYPADAAKVFVTSSAAAHSAGRRRTYAIMASPAVEHNAVAPEGQPAGSWQARFTGVCMLSIHESGTMGQVGYWIGRPYWGQGVATRAVRELMRIARTELPCITLYRAHCLACNPASSRVLEKNGFVFEKSKLKLYPKWRRPRETRFYEFRVPPGPD